jgi:hypothetical protein
MKMLLLFIFLPLTALAELKTEISGNAEIQGRHSWNNEDARKEFFQDWREEDFYLGYGNLNGKATFGQSTIESNVFARHSRSDLYENNFAAARFFNFPERLVARDLFKLQHVHQNKQTRDEVVLNKFYYQWENDEARFMAGRLYINYGLGEIFNPINPFNQPTGLTSISQVAQGNDGLGFSLFSGEKHKVDFYLLGDKRLDGYEGQIERTLWVHGEIQFTGNLAVEYVVGQDQNRDKIGTQVSYQLGDNLLFFQGLYQTALITNKNNSNNLMDILLGYDRQLTTKWHLRMESGYQKQNRSLTGTTTTERFLPTEYFVALSNQYEIHPLVKISATLINDIKSGFTYGLAKLTLSLSDNAETEIFGYSPVARGDEADNLTQKLVTQDIGLALRGYF